MCVSQTTECCSYKGVDLSRSEGVAKVEALLEKSSFVSGDEPVADDRIIFEALSKVDQSVLDEFPRVKGWMFTVNYFTAKVRASWPKLGGGSDKKAAAPLKSSQQAKNTQKVAEKKTAKEEDDPFGDDDLFGDDGGEAAKALQEKLKKEAVERGKKKLAKGRSMIVFEVKPFEPETDLESLAKNIKAIKHEGIQNWGVEHKLVPVAFGIKKLVISAVVFDMLIGMDDIIDMINEKYEDDIQSIDIQSMSKV